MTVGPFRGSLSHDDLSSLARCVTAFWEPFGIWCELHVEEATVYVFIFHGDVARVPIERLRKSIDPTQSTIFYVKRLSTEWESVTCLDGRGYYEHGGSNDEGKNQAAVFRLQKKAAFLGQKRNVMPFRRQMRAVPKKTHTSLTRCSSAPQARNAMTRHPPRASTLLYADEGKKGVHPPSIPRSLHEGTVRNSSTSLAFEETRNRTLGNECNGRASHSREEPKPSTSKSPKATTSWKKATDKINATMALDSRMRRILQKPKEYGEYTFDANEIEQLNYSLLALDIDSFLLDIVRDKNVIPKQVFFEFMTRMLMNLMGDAWNHGGDEDEDEDSEKKEESRFSIRRRAELEKYWWQISPAGEKDSVTVQHFLDWHTRHSEAEPVKQALRRLALEPATLETVSKALGTPSAKKKRLSPLEAYERKQRNMQTRRTGIAATPALAMMRSVVVLPEADPSSEENDQDSANPDDAAESALERE